MVNKTVSFRLSDAILERIDSLASYYGVSRAAVISLAVSQLWEFHGGTQGVGSQEGWDGGEEGAQWLLEQADKGRKGRERKRKR